MSKDKLKQLFESYWYDNQYLNEKYKEMDSLNKLAIIHNDAEFIVDMKETEKQEIKKIISKKKYIESLIQKLEQPYRTIMYLKYISFLTFDQIADKIHYSTKRIYQLHGEALNLLNKIASVDDCKFSTD